MKNSIITDTVFLMLLLHLARPTGLEPATSHVTGECSNQLSYGRIRYNVTDFVFPINSYVPVSRAGLEPTTCRL